MLKTIFIDQLRLGMHVHSLGGAWTDHPLWKTRFVLRDPDDLHKLQTSAVRDCVIDVSKGLDVKAETAVEPAAAGLTDAVVVSVPVVPAPPAASSELKPRVALAEEMNRAAELVNRSRAVVVALFNEARLGHALDIGGCAELVHDVTGSVWRNPGALVSLSRLKTHDDYTYMHSVAVCALMVGLARQIGLSQDEARDAGLAGLLHDTGKAVIPLEVLNKPGKLSDAEFDLVKTHSRRGHALLQTGSQAAPAVALDVCLHHHERPDGAGYPDRLAGDAISREARMGALCDVYDAITSARTYKPAWDPAEAVARMASWRKGQFDEALFQAFVKSLGIYPTGSLVRMQSGRLAVVIEQHPTSMVKPTVRVFFSTKSNMPVPLEVLDLSMPSCSDRIAGRESNTDWKFPHLESLWVDPEVVKRMRKRN